MGFNAEEFEKIIKATSGSEKTQRKIHDSIQAFSDELEKYSENGKYDLKKVERISRTQSLLRQEAVRRGASSHSDPGWAAPAACESWGQAILSENKEDCETIEQSVEQILSDNWPEEESFNFGIPIIFVGIGLTIAFGNIWIAIIAGVIGSIAVGWSKRFDGPFDAK